jgi:hypothetical protein
MWVCAGAIASPVSAQDLQDHVIPSRVIGIGAVELPAGEDASDDRLRELQQWVHEYEKWKQWNQTWRNKREPGWLGARDRRTKPDPPTWLAAECTDAIEDQGLLVDGCRTLADWKDDDLTAALRQKSTTTRTQKEAPSKTVWWEHIHFDALWPMTQVRSNVFGVLGVHATFDVAGRFQIFAAPGAILLNLPSGKNSREWRPATDWGFAYRCFDFTLPGTERRASLHINIAKAWVMSGPMNGVPTSIDLAGFSVTLKKTR